MAARTALGAHKEYAAFRAADEIAQQFEVECKLLPERQIIANLLFEKESLKAESAKCRKGSPQSLAILQQLIELVETIAWADELVRQIQHLSYKIDHLMIQEKFKQIKNDELHEQVHALRSELHESRPDLFPPPPEIPPNDAAAEEEEMMLY